MNKCRILSNLEKLDHIRKHQCRYCIATRRNNYGNRFSLKSKRTSQLMKQKGMSCVVCHSPFELKDIPDIISPCYCKGSIGMYHGDCFWMAIDYGSFPIKNNRLYCGVCYSYLIYSQKWTRAFIKN